MLLTGGLRARVHDEYLVHPQVSLVLAEPGSRENGSRRRQLASREFDLEHSVVETLSALQRDLSVAGQPYFIGVCCYMEDELRYHTIDFVFDLGRGTCDAGSFVRDGETAPLGPIQEWVLDLARLRHAPICVHEHHSVGSRLHGGHNEYCRRLRRYVGRDLLFTVGAGALVMDRDRVLLQRRRDNGRWGLPGGSIEIGERIADGAVREVREETGYEVRITGLGSILTGPECSVVYPNGDRLRFVSFGFDAAVVGGAAIGVTDETLEVGWFDLEALPADLGPIARGHLEQRAKGGDHPTLS